jgi:hypothetical protein
MVIAFIVVVFSKTEGGGRSIALSKVSIVCNFGVLNWLVSDEVVNFNIE